MYKIRDDTIISLLRIYPDGAQTHRFRIILTVFVLIDVKNGRRSALILHSVVNITENCGK